jgi:hypothetical protein
VHPVEVVLVIISSLAAGMHQGSVVVVIVIHKIRCEGCPCHQVFVTGLQGCRRAQGSAYGCILVMATPVRGGPGMVVMAARRIFATSKEDIVLTANLVLV